uniref:non-specific serine/threonine protein kinase n=1 Tax=Oryza sativa subsp. japonica TaxID=39947 RepID=Q2R920_ORYSJ|nr:retrotransposon protein, putative, Ty3-gypsy subclass [Oryza sativa Japonica Group]
MEHEFHDYFKDASLMEQRPIDTSSVTYETISVTPMPKTGIVSNSLPTSSIDVDKKKGKSVIIGDPRPKNRIKNVKAEDYKVAKDESSSFQRAKKPKLTFEMLMAKYKKGLAGQRFDNQTSDSKRPRSSRRKRFGQTPKQSEPSTILTPYKPLNRSGGSKVKKVKKVWERKEAKAPKVVTIKESQDVQVPTGDAAKTIQAEKTEADAITVNIGGLTKTAGRSNRQTTAGLTDPPGRSDRRLAAGLTRPRGRSDRGALSSWKTTTAEVDTFWLISLSKEEGQFDRHCMAGLTGGDLRSDRLCMAGLTGQTGWSDWHCMAGHWFVLVAMDYFTKWTEAMPLENITCTELVNLGSLRYFKQDDLSIEDYKTLMGSNFEDVIDKRLKTLKEMKTLQDGVFREQLMGDSLKKYFPSIWYLGLLLVISLHTPSCSATNDTIVAGQVLAVGEKLISRNGKFALGFFKPALPEGTANTYGNVTSPGWYLAIWFNNIPVCTTVWVANRERPITEPELKLVQMKISEDGSSLVIINHAIKSIVWSTQITNGTAQAKTGVNTSAILLDSGNLVIESLPDVYLWQSFDYPTELVLPGAKIGWNKARGFLTPTYVNNDEEEYLMYHSSDESSSSFVSIDMSGQVKLNIWSQANQSWAEVHAEPWAQLYAQPPDPCTPFATCGPFGICNGNSEQFCDCMESFSQKSPQDWKLKDRSAGCIRNTPLDCPSNRSSTDMFQTIARVTLPANPEKLEDATTQSKCAEVCLSNCSCNAYAYKDSVCSVWHSELLNVKLRDNIESLSEDTLYLRLAAKDMPASTKNKRKPVIAVVTTASIVGFGLLMLVMFFLIWRIKFNCCGVPLHHNQGNSGIIAFKYTDLSHATKNFSEKLGSGGFGSVFKGVLSDSTTIAVKRLDGLHQGEKQFRAEVSSLGLIHHINLVKLIGFCYEGDKRLLVYERMINGSLDAHLFHSNGTILDWSTRHQIAIGVARGLFYLHESCHKCIIHCDIKPENILLEASFAPKIADFGMAAFVGRDFSRVLTSFRGTKGYLAPEWLSGVAITPKVDVYSFGMVLLEIISGRRNLSEAYTSKHYHFDYFPMQAMSKLHGGSV